MLYYELVWWYTDVIKCNGPLEKVTHGKPRVKKQVRLFGNCRISGQFRWLQLLTLIFCFLVIPMSKDTDSGCHGYHILQHHHYFGVLRDLLTYLVI